MGQEGGGRRVASGGGARASSPLLRGPAMHHSPTHPPSRARPPRSGTFFRKVNVAAVDYSDWKKTKYHNLEVSSESRGSLPTPPHPPLPHGGTHTAAGWAMRLRSVGVGAGCAA